jgi:pentatricopeptide repeat protein
VHHRQQDKSTKPDAMIRNMPFPRLSLSVCARQQHLFKLRLRKYHGPIAQRILELKSSQATFQNDFITDFRHYRHFVAFYSTKVSSKLEANGAIKQYLCRETYPIGSLNSRMGAELVNMIEKFTKDGSMESIPLAFEVLDRLAQEIKFEINQENHRTSPRRNSDEMNLGLSIPSDLIHDVIKGWSLCWKSTGLLSPKEVFGKLIGWESLPSNSQPTIVVYNMIVHAAANSHDPDLAEEILNHLLESKNHIDPDVITFNSVIDAWAKSGRQEAPLRAEAVLKKMIALGDAGWHKASPNVISFTSVISAWANSGDQQAPQRAEEILREMTRFGLVPNEVSYLNVLTAWSRSKENMAPERAHAILIHMISQFEEGVADAKPDSHCWSSVISAYANRGDVHRAESILMELYERFISSGDPNYLPHQYCFAAVINAWAKSGRPEAPQTAEAILQRMQDLAESTGESSLRPETVSFTSVLKAWAESNVHDAPIRCEQILQRMQYLYEKGHADCQPNVVSFNTVLDCWAKSSRREAPERAEAILRHMVTLHEGGNDFAKPNAISYSTVMDAWARSGVPNAAERVQALFDELAQSHLDGDGDLKPDTQTFGILITAWGRSKRKDGAVKAQDVFDDMIRRYREGDVDLKPDVVKYTSLIDAWAKAGVPERAQQILVEMDTSTTLKVKPSVVTYNAVMNAWASCGLVDAPERAQALLNELIQKWKAGDESMKPGLHSFSTVIKAWTQSKRKDKGATAQAVVDDLLKFYRAGDDALKPNKVILNSLIDAWAKAGEPNRAERTLREMETFGLKPDAISYNTVLNGWSRAGHPERVQALYHEMIQKSQAGEPELNPNGITYDIVIRAWLKTKRPGTVLNARRVFDDMVRSYESGQRDLKPRIEKLRVLIERSY